MPNWFERGRGRGPVAELIAKRFVAAVRRHGLTGNRQRLRTDLFRPVEGPNGQMLLEI